MHEMAKYEESKYNRWESQHDGASRPMHHRPYIVVNELRMEMRELIQDNRTLHGGIHYPLCIKMGGIGRRSEDAQARRIRGTKQYERKMQNRLSGTAPADDGKEQPSNFGSFVRDRLPSTNPVDFSHIPVGDAWANWKHPQSRPPETNAVAVRAAPAPAVT